MADLVSAIVPCYNYGRSVGQAIESVLKQTYSPIECIVVDDGSTDETPSVVARFERRVRLIRQENQGISAARNAGITAARADFLAFLDADDCWYPEKIARQLDVLKRRPELGAVGCATEIVNADRSTSRIYLPPVPSDRLAQNLRNVAMRRLWVGGSMSGALVRREVFGAVGLLDTNLRASEDRDFWMRLVARYPFENLPDVLVMVHSHGTGLSAQVHSVIDSQWRLYEKAVCQWPDVFNPRIRREWRALIAADAGTNYILNGDARGAFRAFCQSLREWPWCRRRWGAVARLGLKLCLQHNV